MDHQADLARSKLAEPGGISAQVQHPSGTRLALVAAVVVVAWGGLCPTERQLLADDFLTALARDAEPTGKPDIRRVAAYLQVFQSKIHLDPRLTAWHVRAEASDSGIRLEGSVEWKELRWALGEYFRQLGFDEVQNNLTLYPDPALGDRRYGMIQVQRAASYDRPTGEQELVTECLLGDPVWILSRAEGDTFLCHSSEGYLGYVSAKAIRLMDREEFYAGVRGPRIRFKQDYHVGGGVPDLPAGASIHRFTYGPGRAQVTLVLPSGQVLEVGADDVEREKSGPAAAAVRSLETARSFLGTHYLWGGKTSKGIDCSGLVQVSYGAAGVRLPRDSNQQAITGRLAAIRGDWEALLPGDTMYFVNRYGRISHTALYLGNGKLIEATTPHVRIASMRRGDREFDERRAESFVFGKRVLDGDTIPAEKESVSSN